MTIDPTRFIRSTLLLVPAIGLVLGVSIANGQTGGSTQDQVATLVSSPSAKAAASVPVFTDYRGVRIGMSAKEVRAKLERLKKDSGQDVLVYSEHESAQIYYDDKGKVSAISIDYFDNNKAPKPVEVLGAELQAREDGSMYELKRYPEAGYWVSYNRTASDKPIITITMQKM